MPLRKLCQFREVKPDGTVMRCGDTAMAGCACCVRHARQVFLSVRQSRKERAFVCIADRDSAARAVTALRERMGSGRAAQYFGLPVSTLTMIEHKTLRDPDDPSSYMVPVESIFRVLDKMEKEAA